MANKFIICLIISLGLSQNADSLYKQGSSYLESGQYEKAVSMFESILNQEISHENHIMGVLGKSQQRGDYLLLQGFHFLKPQPMDR